MKAGPRPSHGPARNGSRGLLETSRAIQKSLSGKALSKNGIASGVQKEGDPSDAVSRATLATALPMA